MILTGSRQQVSHHASLVYRNGAAYSRGFYHSNRFQAAQAKEALLGLSSDFREKIAAIKSHLEDGNTILAVGVSVDKIVPAIRHAFGTGLNSLFRVGIPSFPA